MNEVHPLIIPQIVPCSHDIDPYDFEQYHIDLNTLQSWLFSTIFAIKANTHEYGMKITLSYRYGVEKIYRIWWDYRGMSLMLSCHHARNRLCQSNAN